MESFYQLRKVHNVSSVVECASLVTLSWYQPEPEMRSVYTGYSFGEGLCTVGAIAPFAGDFERNETLIQSSSDAENAIYMVTGCLAECKDCF